MKTKPRENERRDSALVIVLILLLGFFCIIFASGWALRFAPSWKLNTSMGSNLNPSSDFLTSRPVSFIEPLDPAILTNPAWMDVFLTPGASLSFPTRTPLPTFTASSIPPKTNTPVTPTLIPSATNTLIIASPTNTKATSVPPFLTGTASPTATNTPVPPLPSANLQISKTDGLVSVIAGGTTTYTVRVTNNGPSSVTGAILSDPIAAGLNKTGVACSATPGQCVTAPTVAQLQAGTFALPALVSGQFYEITVTANVTALSGNVTNTATVSTPVGTIDPTPGNNTASDTNAVTLIADLVITKTDGVAAIITGGTTTYTVRVTNNGPSNVTGAVLSDPLATGLNKTVVACSVTPGQCVTAPTTAQLQAGTFALPALVSGQFYEITITANVTALSGSVTNTVTVTTPVGTTDLAPGNNTASDTDTVTPITTDLAITKNDSVAAVIAGGTTTYTVRVTNNGPSSVTGAILSDPFATGLSKTGVACSATPGQCVTAPTVVQLETGAFALPALVSGQFYEITVTANVTALSGSVTNIATVSTPVGTTDPTPGNDTASDTDTVSLVTDLAITKTDLVATYTPGGAPLTYTITVANNGPDAVTGATVTDNIPAQIISANWTCATSGSAACGAVSGSGNINELVNLPVGSTVTYTVTANTSALAVGTINNTANVNVPVGVTETNASNNTATDSDTSNTTDPNIGPPDGSWVSPGPGTFITMVFSPPVVVNGDVGTYDFVYYERLASPTSVDFDWVQVEISPDGITWYQVLYWGDPGGVPDTNTNVDLSLVGDICQVAGVPTENDNCNIPIARLYNNNSTGIAIDVDGIGIPLGSYPWMRITSPAGGANGTDVDAIQILP